MPLQKNMVGTAQSNTIIIVASGLGIALCLPALIWRSYIADKLRDEKLARWKEDHFLLGLVVFLIISLILHIFWLISSFVLFIWGQRGYRAVMWIWTCVTWLIIIIDTAFFGYFAYHFQIPISETSKVVAENTIQFYPSKIMYLSPFYMLLLLIHTILAYLSIRVAYYAWTYGKIPDYVMCHALDPMENNSNESFVPDQNPRFRQSLAGTQVHQNGAYTKSADDVRFGVMAYGDRSLGSRHRRYIPEIVQSDYNQRASRGNMDVRY